MSKIIKFLYSSLFYILLCWLAVNILLYIQLPNMVFYPLEKIDATPKEWGLEYKNVNLKLTSGKPVSGWYLPHPSANKTILFFHGNGGNISHRGDSLFIFHKLKLNTLIIDYPGYGDSAGHPSEDGLYQSADAAWQYLIDEEKIEPKNIIIFGRSLGGAVAVDLASRVNAGGLILESTFSSTRDFVDMTLPIISNFIYLRYSFDSLSKINKVKYPVFMIHSPDDEIIPYTLGKKLFMAGRTKKQFLKIKGGHNDGFMQSSQSYTQALRRYIQSL